MSMTKASVLSTLKADGTSVASLLILYCFAISIDLTVLLLYTSFAAIFGETFLLQQS